MYMTQTQPLWFILYTLNTLLRKCLFSKCYNFAILLGFFLTAQGYMMCCKAHTGESFVPAVRISIEKHY